MFPHLRRLGSTILRRSVTRHALAAAAWFRLVVPKIPEPQGLRAVGKRTGPGCPVGHQRFRDGLRPTAGTRLHLPGRGTVQAARSERCTQWFQEITTEVSMLASEAGLGCTPLT